MLNSLEAVFNNDLLYAVEGLVILNDNSSSQHFSKKMRILIWLIEIVTLRYLGIIRYFISEFRTKRTGTLNSSLINKTYFLKSTIHFHLYIIQLIQYFIRNIQQIQNKNHAWLSKYLLYNLSLYFIGIYSLRNVFTTFCTMWQTVIDSESLKIKTFVCQIFITEKKTQKRRRPLILSQYQF